MLYLPKAGRLCKSLQTKFFDPLGEEDQTAVILFYNLLKSVIQHFHYITHSHSQFQDDLNHCTIYKKKVSW